MEKQIAFASLIWYEYKCMRYGLKDGTYHRGADLPAIDCEDGAKRYFKFGKLHREGDKPAWIDASGCKKWYKNGHFIKEEGCD